MNGRQVAIYRSDRVRDLYVFVDAGQSLDVLPEGLRKHVEPAVQVMTLDLHPGRRLARANAANVLTQIASAGFYVQLPPEPEALPPRGTEVDEP